MLIKRYVFSLDDVREILIEHCNLDFSDCGFPNLLRWGEYDICIEGELAEEFLKDDFK